MELQMASHILWKILKLLQRDPDVRAWGNLKFIRRLLSSQEIRKFLYNKRNFAPQAQIFWIFLSISTRIWLNLNKVY